MIKIYIEDEILNNIKNLIKPEFLKSSDLVLNNNKSTYKSINIVTQPSAYTSNLGNKFLFARLKTSGKLNYISFNEKYAFLFNRYNINYKLAKDRFLRVDLNLFDEYSLNDLSIIFNKIFIDSFNYPSFGCCSRYVECSDKKRCVHPDIIYASCSCMYKKNLDNNRIFYCKNKNI